MDGAPEHSLTLMIGCSDEMLVEDVHASFGERNVSVSSNFIGGVSIAVFFASIKVMRPTIQAILDFLAHRGDRYDDAVIVFDGKKLELKGYGPDEAEQILSNPVFASLRK